MPHGLEYWRGLVSCVSRDTIAAHKKRSQDEGKDLRHPGTPTQDNLLGKDANVNRVWTAAATPKRELDFIALGQQEFIAALRQFVGVEEDIGRGVVISLNKPV